MVLKLDSKRRLTLPKSLAGEVKPGDSFEAHYDAEEDAVIFRKLPSTANWLTVLKQCPVDMDDLPERSREMFHPRL